MTSSRIEWAPCPERDLHLERIGRAVRWQCAERTGVLWVDADRCDTDDSFDVAISAAVLVSALQHGWNTSTVCLRRRGCPADAWQILAVPMNHAPGVDAAVTIPKEGIGSGACQILVDSALVGSSRGRAAVRWGLRCVGECGSAAEAMRGWRLVYRHWHRLLWSHPSVRGWAPVVSHEN